MPIDTRLKNYVETVVLPRYEAFDRGHDRTHVERVIAESLALAQNYDVDINMVYVVAAYHDVGLPQGRERHHIYSAQLLLNDKNLRRWFSEADLRLMADAIEDHRASGSRPPRSIYGCIVAEADRDITPELILRRTLRFSLRSSPTPTPNGIFSAQWRTCTKNMPKVATCACGCTVPKTSVAWPICARSWPTKPLCASNFANFSTKKRATVLWGLL